MKEPITAIGIIADINRRFAQAGKGYSTGLEQEPPKFDPALYEEPTGLQQCLEMLEQKYGLPRRAK